MDFITVALLSFFGALAAGGLVGWLVGHFTKFELGLGVGLLIPGVVALAFAWHSLAAFHRFTTPVANKVEGEVVDIRDVKVGESGTQPAPLVRFRTAAGAEVTVLGPRASSAKVGDRLAVIYDVADPQRAEIGDPGELRGGAVAFLLFGTFPASFGLFLLVKPVLEKRAVVPKEGRRPLNDAILVVANLLIFGGIVWPGFSDSALERDLMVSFGVVSAGILLHGVRGLFDRATSAAWTLGMLVLGLNFGVWTFALWLLFEPGA